MLSLSRGQGWYTIIHLLPEAWVGGLLRGGIIYPELRSGLRTTIVDSEGLVHWSVPWPLPSSFLLAGPQLHSTLGGELYIVQHSYLLFFYWPALYILSQPSRPSFFFYLLAGPSISEEQLSERHHSGSIGARTKRKLVKGTS